MNKDLDARLPKTTSYWMEDQIFFIKNTKFFVSEAEGHAMADLLIYAMEEKSTKGLVIDNREAKGAWPKDISQIWESNPKYLKVIKNKKIATLIDSAVKTMQLNRLSKELGMENTSKAFSEGFNEDVIAFLLA